jgi:hypothetical protein
MTTGHADAPMEPVAPGGAVAGTHGEALPAAGLGGALFAQWGRTRRRQGLAPRYGEDAVLVDDGDGETAFQYGPMD